MKLKLLKHPVNGGIDSDRVAIILNKSQRYGIELLSRLSRPAIQRLIDKPKSLVATNFYSYGELTRLARLFAAVIASSDLLGRSRIHLRLGSRPTFSEWPTNFSIFADSDIPLLEPTAAVAWFKSLVPSLGVNAERFGQWAERKAFTMALATSKTVLEKVKKIITDALEGKEDQRSGPKKIDAVLEAAGIHPKNPHYSKMVFRTNMMEAYNAGAWREFSDPALAEAFPVWRYIGIHDGRERPSHRAHFDKIFDRKVPFALVRGTEIKDVANCRCAMVPVYKSEWEEMQRKGVKITPWKTK